MPASLDTSALGFPVEVTNISKELKKLWETTGGTQTRASLINFAVYFRGLEGSGQNTEFIKDFTREHACRALLICHEPNSTEDKVSAFINAHCHLTRAGAKQICCEQVSLLFEGKTAGRIANTLFANLDSDLPLYLWWQGEFPETIDETLWSRVDRLIYDSQVWANPKEQFRRLRDSLGELGHHEASAVVSGLPLMTKPVRTRMRLLREAFAFLQPQAPFVQFTYAVVPPIPRLAGVQVEASERIWLNLPPARVWVYRNG